MLSIVAMTLFFRIPFGALLVFSLPLMLLAVGRAADEIWPTRAAVAAFILAAATVSFNLGFLLVTMLLAGPIVSVVLVGRLLRELDLVAAGAFFLTGSIVLIAGFAGAELEATPVVIGGAATLGLLVVGFRLRDPQLG
jgi:hypothetical protein